MHDYKKLKIWKLSADLAVEIYKVTEKFPKEETFGLTSQLRRSAVSIPSNIAEGSKRSTKKDFKSFLFIAHGSGAELETQLYISKEIGYLTDEKYTQLLTKVGEIMKMTAVFIRTLAT